MTRDYPTLAPAQIKQLRKTLGRSQEEMASLFELHFQTWHRWETGKTHPSRRDSGKLVRLYTQYVVAGVKNEEVVQ